MDEERILNEQALDLLDEAMFTSSIISNKERKNGRLDEWDNVFPTSRKETERMEQLLNQAEAVVEDPKPMPSVWPTCATWWNGRKNDIAHGHGNSLPVHSWVQPSSIISRTTTKTISLAPRPTMQQCRLGIQPRWQSKSVT